MNATAAISNVLVLSYYISTGRLNAMYTLRCTRRFEGARPSAMMDMMCDSYICNLAAAGNEDAAEEKARAYVDALRERMGDQSDRRLEFFGDFDNAAYKRRGTMTTRESRALDYIEDGIFPFGKHEGKRIADAPADYLLYFADKAHEIGETDPIMFAMANACAGAALELGHIARREQLRALSQHVGTVGERTEFEGTVAWVVEREGQFGATYMHKILAGDNVLMYRGTVQLAKKGDSIKFKATVKSHGDYKGEKQTNVSRPVKL